MHLVEPWLDVGVRLVGLDLRVDANQEQVLHGTRLQRLENCDLPLRRSADRDQDNKTLSDARARTPRVNSACLLSLLRQVPGRSNAGERNEVARKLRETSRFIAEEDDHEERKQEQVEDEVLRVQEIRISIVV